MSEYLGLVPVLFPVSLSPPMQALGSSNVAYVIGFFTTYIRDLDLSPGSNLKYLESEPANGSSGSCL